MPIRNRRGFSLAEILVALVILGIVGAAMTRVLVNQNRYFDKQTNMRVARSIARNSMNILLADLRMVQDSGGVDSVSSDFKAMRVLVPYRFGLVCYASGSNTTVSMLPVDSATGAMSRYKGFAYRNTAGRYTYVYPTNPTSGDAPQPAATPANCTGNGAGQAQINTVSLSGRTGNIYDLKSPGPSGATPPAPMFFFQRVTYVFKTSSAYPTKLGLWRIVDGDSAAEELMAPFDTSAGFRYYLQGTEGAETTVPALANIRGVDVLLYSVSPRGTSNQINSSPSKMVTSVFFKNVRSY